MPMGSLSTTTELPFASASMNEMIIYVRTFLRDFPELNRLTKGYDHSNTLIAWAIADAIDDWNTTPPFIGSVGLESFPSKHLLCRAATISLLESLGILQTRNSLSFSDGGITVNLGQPQMLQQWIAMFKSSYEDKKHRMKSSMNLEMAMDGGGVISEYFFVNGHYLSGGM